MRQVKHFAMSGAAIAMATAAAATALGSGTGAPARADDPSRETMMPLSVLLRRCDFTDDTHVSPTGRGSATSVIRESGSQVAADVSLQVGTPNTAYRVRLIQVPRETLSCAPGTPGTGFGILNTDGAGNGNTTVQDTVLPGATGVWVLLEGDPGDFYTSDAIVRV